MGDYLRSSKEDACDSNVMAQPEDVPIVEKTVLFLKILKKYVLTDHLFIIYPWCKLSVVNLLPFKVQYSVMYANKNSIVLPGNVQAELCSISMVLHITQNYPTPMVAVQNIAGKARTNKHMN